MFCVNHWRHNFQFVFPSFTKQNVVNDWTQEECWILRSSDFGLVLLERDKPIGNVSFSSFFFFTLSLLVPFRQENSRQRCRCQLEVKVSRYSKCCNKCFYFSHFDWICCDGTEGVCMYVCMYVCMCVCDSATAQTDGWILMKFSTNDLTDIFEVRFSQI